MHAWMEMQAFKDVPETESDPKSENSLLHMSHSVYQKN